MSPKQTLFMPHLVVKIAFPSDNRFWGDVGRKAKFYQLCQESLTLSWIEAGNRVGNIYASGFQWGPKNCVLHYYKQSKPAVHVYTTNTGYSELVHFEEAFKELSCIAESYSSLSCKSHTSLPFFFMKHAVCKESLSPKKHFEESSVYTFFPTWPLCPCKMSCSYVFPCWKNIHYQTGLERLTSEEGKRQQKKNSCWRAERIQTCVHSDRLVPNQRGSCHHET